MNDFLSSNVSSTYENIDLITEVEGSNPHELIDLLLKGSLTKISRAKGYINEGQHAKKGQELGKVISIFTELIDCLDFSVESSISRNLKSLYAYIIDLVSNANLSNNIDPLDEASELISSIRESWNLIPVELREQ